MPRPRGKTALRRQRQRLHKKPVLRLPASKTVKKRISPVQPPRPWYAVLAALADPNRIALFTFHLRPPFVTVNLEGCGNFVVSRAGYNQTLES